MTSSRQRRRRRIEPFIALMAILAMALSLAPSAAATPSFTDASIPSTAEAGQPIFVWANVTSSSTECSVYISYVNPANDSYTYTLMVGNGTDGTWTYTIPAQPWKGTLQVMMTVIDGSGSAQYPGSGFKTVEITGESQPKPFPWNIAFMVVFLGVVLVLTELAFKPGFYRKTGRERARELEEEDRKRESEMEKKN